MSKPRTKGFTLVELLVVMAILAVLIALSIAGIGYAMRRSRNIARQAAAENMMVGLEAYYTDNQDYPDEPLTLDLVFGPDLADFDLKEYLESTWDAPPSTFVHYMTNTTHQLYTVCVNQELWNSSNYDWVCQGTGVGNTGDGFPPREISDLAAPCSTCGGVCGLWCGEDWSAACTTPCP